MNRPKSWATYVLIALNIVIFFAETIAGGSEDTEVAITFGALYTPLVVGYGQWWRVFTAMFLHFGIEHIGANMISLFAVGPYAEAWLGKVRYIILYLFSGICGNLLTMAVEMGTGSFAVSAGASGAICGLLSVFIIFAIMPETRKYFSLPRVLGAIFLTLLPGITDHSISMTAHLGGLAGGFVMALLMSIAKRNRLKRERRW